MITRIKSLTMYSLLLVCLVMPVLAVASSPCQDKKIIGQECRVHIKELGLDFLARVDTGSTTTSLHATDFLIRGGTDDPLDNVGKTINFLTETGDGHYKRLTAEIVKVQTVANAQGHEKRYMVRLTLSAKGISKTILVNLRDRSQLKYRLLIGRDWLAEDFLVDVQLEKKGSAEESEEE